MQTYAQWQQQENKVNVIWHDITDKLEATSHLKYPYGPNGLDLYCRPPREDWNEQLVSEPMHNHQDYDLLFYIDASGLTDEEKNL